MRRLTELVLMPVLVACVVVGLLWRYEVISFVSGDDRPAIVLYGGSVTIESLVDAADQRRGTFEPVIQGNNTRWLAGVGPGPTPTSLTVVISNSVTATAECQSTVVHRGVPTVIFSYLPTAGIPRQFQADITADGLVLSFPVDAVQPAGQTYRLSLPNAVLKAVTIGGLNCDLGPDSRVEVRQRQ